MIGWSVPVQQLFNDEPRNKDGSITAYPCRCKQPYAHPDHTHIQFYGWEIVLKEDGTWYPNDTSGG